MNIKLDDLPNYYQKQLTAKEALFLRQSSGKYSKYRNVPTKVLGIQFRSKREAIYALFLDAMVKQKIIKRFDYELRYELVVNDKILCWIVPDFTVVLPNNEVEIHEIKQPHTKTSTWRLKWKLLSILRPDLILKVIESTKKQDWLVSSA